MKKLTALLCLLVIGQLAASPLPDFPFVAVEGTASEKVTPDKAVITFNIVVFDASSEVASNTMDSTTSRVLEIITDNGISTDAVTSYEIDKNIKYKEDENYNEIGISGYTFSRRFSLRLDEIASFSGVVDNLLKTQNVSNVDSTFDSSKREQIEVALISKATDRARRKATQMAKGLGVELDSVFAFNDSGSFNQFFATFSFGSSDSISVSGRRVYRMAAEYQSDRVYLVPQHIEVSKTINVIYKIKP